MRSETVQAMFIGAAAGAVAAAASAALFAAVLPPLKPVAAATDVTQTAQANNCLQSGNRVVITFKDNTIRCEAP